jgi:hypothetical protein
MVPVNYLAVLVAGILAMVIGFLWYGPLFGKTWAAMMGFNETSMADAKAKGMTKTYVINFIAALIMAYVLAHSLIFASAYTSTSGVSAGLMVGFWSWIGFIVPVTLGSVLWDGKPWKLWAINAGYYLVLLLVMGVLLAVWA